MLLAVALLMSVLGLACLALSMERHWRQLRHAEPLPQRTARTLRVTGSLWLAASLWVCLAADHASMASLVWVMTIAVAAVSVAMLLAWRPAWLAPLIFWSRSGAR